MPAEDQERRKSPSGAPYGPGPGPPTSGARLPASGALPGEKAPAAPGPAVRPASASQLDEVAMLHATEISEGFLSGLGVGFLRRLYRRIERSPGSFVLVHAPGREVEGFVAGSVDVRGLYRAFLWRDGPAAFLEAAPRLLRFWRRALETLRHGGGDASLPGSGELLSIAVAPRSRGRGIALRLVEAFMEELDQRQVASAHVVVADANVPAVRLYSRCGFVPAQVLELHAGTRSIVMERHRTRGDRIEERGR